MEDLVVVLQVVAVTAINHAEYPVSVPGQMNCSSLTTIKAFVSCMGSTFAEDFFTGYCVRIIEDAEGTSIFILWVLRWYHAHCDPALFAYVVGIFSNLVTTTCADFKLSLAAKTVRLKTIFIPLMTTNAFKLMCWLISPFFILSI